MRIAKNEGQGTGPERIGTAEWEIDHLMPMLRQIVSLHLEQTMRKELDALLGYAEYERKPEGVTDERNGSYGRGFMTRLGPVELEIPRDRQGQYRTQVVGRYQKREPKVNRLILEMFIGGISTRKMKKLTRMLLGRGYSASTISEINKTLTAEMKAWFYGPIEEDISLVFIDGVNLPVRRFHVSKESLLVALGATRDGRRRILGVSLGDRESAESWRQFLAELKKRGLKSAGVKLGVMDGLPGLETAFEESFPKARVQRCVFHKLSNVAVKIPASIQADCLSQLKRVLSAKNEAEARERAQVWKEHWEKTAPSAVECFFKDLDAVLTFYRFPKRIWKSIRTTNIIERLFKEFRRRTRSMDSFPNEDCALRCIYGISRNLDETWRKRRLWRGDPFGEAPSEAKSTPEVPGYPGDPNHSSQRILERSVETQSQKIPENQEVALIG